MWLVLNDAIIGVAFGSFLCENSDVLARMSDDFLQVRPILSLSKTNSEGLVALPCPSYGARAAMAEQLAGRPEAQHRAQSILLSFSDRTRFGMGLLVAIRTRISSVKI